MASYEDHGQSRLSATYGWTQDKVHDKSGRYTENETILVERFLNLMTVTADYRDEQSLSTAMVRVGLHWDDDLRMDKIVICQKLNFCDTFRVLYETIKNLFCQFGQYNSN